MTKPTTHETKEPGALFPKSQKKDLCVIREAATKLHLEIQGAGRAVDSCRIFSVIREKDYFFQLCHQSQKDYTQDCLR